MAELLPLSQAETIKASLLDYLGTTFALADPDAKQVLDEFLQDPKTGMFRGPYVRLRLPFRPAADGWRESLEWYEGFTPYGHQAAAFERLSSYNLTPEKPRPQPTLVTTGTGSGKTETFLYPILDHVQRAKRNGQTGTKALVLYPMNALANDQASRLTELLTSNPALGGITAALYTGESGPKRGRVTAEGLITEREIIRDTAPDILLTNYKMLDQLLLRPADAELWKQSATSLQYLVLDEFHTYDGAQGTDVSMLLRRLGQTLKSYWHDDEPGITTEDRERPLGRITPVATSATLGDGNDPTTMLEFAHTVFGDAFTAESVVTESRRSVADWSDGAEARVTAAGLPPKETDTSTIAAITADPDDPFAASCTVLGTLYQKSPAAIARAIGQDESLLLDLVRAHPMIHELMRRTRAAVTVDELGGPHVVGPLLTLLSHVRASPAGGRAAASVEVHLWIRELTRIDRALSGAPRFIWADDGVVIDQMEDHHEVTYLPSTYCRHCNRSGWGAVLAPTGTDLDADDTTIRRRSLNKDDRFRALIHAPKEALDAEAGPAASPDDPTGLAWLMVQERRISLQRPDELYLAEGLALPVLMNLGDDAGADSVKQTCPSCKQPDGIRFLGSAIATMLSVSMSTLFGTPELDSREKRALVFTDSVQDAAHRAGFVQARSHALTLRTLIRQALNDGPSDLDSLTHRVLALAGDDQAARFRLLPPELAERSDFAKFWTAKTAAGVPLKLRNAMARRLALDTALEFGLRSGVGRTMERTGTALAYLDVPTSKLLAIGHEVVRSPDVQTSLDDPEDAILLRWIQGVLLHLRQRGAIAHPWFERYRQEDGNRWWITGGRKRGEGMPGFGRGSSAPAYPITGKSGETDLEPIASPRGWYAKWTAKSLGMTAIEGGTLARILFDRLHHRDVVERTTTQSGAQTYGLPPTSVIARTVTARELADDAVSLICSTCRAPLYSAPEVVQQMLGAPCLVQRCEGTLQRHHIDDNFYRHMYASTDIRRVVAREHTSLLPDEKRLEYENRFKMTDPPPNAPNVLVATPTLEMGIDIGDLSAVMLSSLPRTVASYLQRVGRAGRLTGNALALAYVTGRGDQLPRFTRPDETINGTVRPPATYLDAEEILRRQFTASVADILARRPDTPHPHTTPDALKSTGPQSYLGALIAEAESRAADLVDQFLGAFPPLGDDVTAHLRQFPDPADGPGTSLLAQRCQRASFEWNRRIETLQHRLKAVRALIPELRTRATSPAATSDDKDELRTAEATARLIDRQLTNLNSTYWISALETFGLFPNYTLLDDSVTLAVSVNWRDPDTEQYESDDFEINRGSAQALRDFAPGSTFYANGFEIHIDAVDLGIDSEEVHEWACCAQCGYVEDLSQDAAAKAPSKCPRCGSSSLADTGQRLPVVELKNVSSVIRRDEATIDDARDERARQLYRVVTAADVDPAEINSRWFVQGLGLGVTHVRRLKIRWINMGTGLSSGASRIVAGVDVEASLFRVCRECGKLDRSARTNRPAEHRPWCPKRAALDEDAVSVALARAMTTEGLVLRLPVTITLGDTFAVPSLAAALLLGLRERIGGAPDHLHVASIAEPSGDDTVRPSLLLHDTVPGGTGYLADLAQPDAVWDLLYRAWEVVHACECQNEGKLACDRCLLPFASLADLRYTSRSQAEKHLVSLLTGDTHGYDEDVEVPTKRPWEVTAVEPETPDDESDLEKRFRVAFRKRLETLGATISEKPTDRGVEWKIALGSANQWTLQPQQNLLGSKPDFVLSSTRSGVPPTAIFTDGWQYHASSAHNRLADDAEKRRNLRSGGYQVIAVTRDDVDGKPMTSSVFHPNATPLVLKAAGDGLAKSAVDLVFKNALDLLVAWVQNPSHESRKQLAHWAPMLAVFSLGAQGTRTSADSPVEAALARLDGIVPASDGDLFVGRKGDLAFSLRLRPHGSGAEVSDVAVVYDDAEHTISIDGKQSWREWLHWSNLLNFRVLGSDVTTRRHAAAVPPSASVPESAPSNTATATTLTGAWLEAFESTSAPELIAAIAAASLPLPTVGEEAAGGIPLEISWPAVKVVLDIELAEDELAQLTSAGWAVCAPDVDILRSTLSEKGL
ncbi:DEAD/DEAH box helicase [Tsukamurella asaccharolytica]|uniref:DEAD/DEAH box helicase n=1 Tax=Tsukamurella asaccharolytica TaxID=2592067 RepID=A0A5C5RA44_9ACTN|nr:DEAD/DEAH box helicase [Tsukamurella asaccharolytica]TWS20027.1 DEAD/DEAH box helicase [Tsukamurella asaccharolytica]